MMFESTITTSITQPEDFSPGGFAVLGSGAIVL